MAAQTDSLMLLVHLGFICSLWRKSRYAYYRVNNAIVVPDSNRDLAVDSRIALVLFNLEVVYCSGRYSKTISEVLVSAPRPTGAVGKPQL